MKITRFAGAPAPRSLVSAIRAETNDPKVILASLQASFDAYKTAQDARLGKVEAKVDPLDIEQIGKIGATVLELQAALDAQAVKLAAAQMHAGGNKAPSDPDYTAKFTAWFRDGENAGEVKAAQLKGPRAALSEGVNTSGGFVTPVEWDRTVTEKLKLVSPVRAEATVQQIGKIGFSKLYTDRVVGSGWVGETAARPATTTPGFASLNWAVGELYANPAITQDLLDDALIDIEGWLASEVDVEFARQEGIAFLSGTGLNMPTGLLTYLTGAANAALHPYGAIQTLQTAAVGAIASKDVTNLVYALPSMWANNSKFFANRTAIGQVMGLQNAQGTFIWQPSFAAGQPATLMGAAIIELPDMPAPVSGNPALLFGDMRATYLVVDRMGIRVTRDPYTNKPFVQFYTTKRVGGGVNQPQAMVALTIK